MALTSVVTNTKRPSLKTKKAASIDNTFTVKETYIYELLNNKIDILRKETELNIDALKTEIANNRDTLKAEIASNRDAIKTLKTELRAEIASNRDTIKTLKTELRAEIASNRDALRAEIASNRELFLTHFKIMRWILGLIFVFIFSIATKLFFF